MFDSIRYDAYQDVAIYNDGSDGGFELTINFRTGQVYYANAFVQYPSEHDLF